MTDHELMARVQTGDAGAFGLLHDRLAGRAHRVARTVCRDDEHARDAVQEGFASVWQARGQYRQQPAAAAVQSWVLTIVRHRAVDTARRHGRHDRRRDDRGEGLERVPAPGDVAADLVVAEDAHLLRALLAALPASQREVLALAYFGQLSQAEIAERLRLPLGTVKGRARLGLARLRRQLVTG